MAPQRARSEEASPPADAPQPAPVGGASDANTDEDPAADPVLHTLAGLLQRTRAARRVSLDFPPVRRQSGAFRASSSEGLRSVSTLSTAGDCGGGPSLTGSRASVDGAASGSDAAAAGPAGSRASSPPPADWDACGAGTSLSNSTTDARQGGGPGTVTGSVPGVDNAERSMHSGRSWADAFWSQTGAADGSQSQGSSHGGTDATATMLPHSRALAALFLRTKQQGVLTTPRPSQRLQLPAQPPQAPDDSHPPLSMPMGASFKVEAADADDFHGGWAGRLASACIDKATSGMGSAPSAGALALRASASRNGEELSRTGFPAAAPPLDTAFAASAATQADGLQGQSNNSRTRRQSPGARGEGELDTREQEAPAAVVQMPFTGALDSVLEQHRSAREGILEANMNPAAVVKALRAESAPANSKHTQQTLDGTRSTSMPQEYGTKGEAASAHVGLRTTSATYREVPLIRASSIAESLTDGEAMSRVLVEHWSRLDTLGAARGDPIAVAESMRPADSTSPVRRSASVGTRPNQSCNPVDLLLASRRRSTDAQTSQPIGISPPPLAGTSPPEDGFWAQGNLRAFSVPSITNQLRTSALAAAVDADRQHGRGAAAQQLHQQRPPPAPSAGAGVSRGRPTQAGGALAAPELQPVLEHGSAQDEQSIPQLSGADPAASQPVKGRAIALPMAGGSTFALAGPRIASAFSEAGGSGHGAVNTSSSKATPIRGNFGQSGLASAAAVALHSAAAASSAAERMLAESIARHNASSRLSQFAGSDVFSSVRSNSAATRAGSGGGSLRVGSGAGCARVGSATSSFTEAMLMRRAAGPATSGQTDSTLADVIARYSANVSSLQPRAHQQQEQEQQQQQLESGAAASPGNTAAAALTTAPLAVRVSWLLPPPEPLVTAQPVSPSTVASVGGSWRDRDARRSGDSSSSGEYPGCCIRSLPLLLSTDAVTERSESREAGPADAAGTVSGYLHSIRRHWEGDVVPSAVVAGPAQGLRGPAGMGEESAAGNASSAASATEGGVGQDDRLRCLPASSSTRSFALSRSFLWHSYFGASTFGSQG